MKLWTISDLHIDRKQGPLDLGPHPDHDVIVMAGDLCDADYDPVPWLTSEFSAKELSKFVYVPGNHDYYRFGFDAEPPNFAAMRALGIRVLDSDVAIIDGFRFVGTALWSDIDIPEAGNTKGDFKHIPGLTPRNWGDLHKGSMNWLRRISIPGDIVVSHHAPSREGLAEEMQASPERMLWWTSYASLLDDWIVEHAPAVWIYGHTHVTRRVMIGEVPVVSNALGRGPDTHFIPDMVLDIPEAFRLHD